jgi:hypothetical protein
MHTSEPIPTLAPPTDSATLLGTPALAAGPVAESVALAAGILFFRRTG